MNQGKLEVIKQEMARMKIGILGIRTLKLGMGEFNSNGHYIYYHGKNFGERVGTVSDFIFGGSKITSDGDRSHEIKRHLLLER